MKKEIERVPDVAGEFSNTLARNTDFTCKELVEVVGEPLSKGITDSFKEKDTMDIENASDIKSDDPWMKEDFWDRVFADYSLADDILNIPYIDSDNMDEYLNNLADRARKLEIKRDDIKRLLNMRYSAPQVKFDTEKHKEWLYDKFGVKPMFKNVEVTDIPGGINITAEKIHSNINLISIEVKEDVDNFIFETIKPWCEERIQRKICKADLEQALLMYYSLDKEDPKPTVFNNEKR